jgi:hypothetical protein
MPHISAVLITYNEEADLPEALTSLAGVAEVPQAGRARARRETAISRLATGRG